MINIINQLIKKLNKKQSTTDKQGGNNTQKTNHKIEEEKGMKFIQKKEYEKAEEIFRGIVRNEPSSPTAYGLLGAACGMQGKLDLMKKYSQMAIDLNDQYPMAHNNLGYALEREGLSNEAIVHFKLALKLKPKYVDCHVNLGLALLKSGDYINGWSHYEWRLLSNKYNRLKAIPPCPQFSGGSLKGKQLLIVYEQGLGDVIQCMRFVNFLKSHGVTCSFCAPKKLHRLIQTSDIVPSPLTWEEANTITDGQWMPLFSIPRYLCFGPDNPANNQPYIRSSIALTSKWERILNKENKFTVGINWSGNRKDKDKLGRNIPVDQFNALADIDQIQLLSLQRRPAATPTWVSDQLINIQNQIDQIINSDDADDFLEYAAIIENCDLIITCATTTAHLAAGMGKPTWVMLEKVPDWRWGLEGNSTFWYPTMRLFRQTNQGEWHHVIKKIKESLLKHLSSS